MAKNTKSTPSVGDVFRIKLEAGFFGYCVIAGGEDCAFFDFRTAGDAAIDLDSLVAKTVAFRVFVAWDAFRGRGWKLIGNANLPPNLREPATYWHQSVGSNDIFLIRSEVRTHSTEEAASGLEQYAVWFGAHIMDRLEDHFAGRENMVHKEMSKILKY